MNFFFTNIYIFFMALVLAVLEIQIEGAHGWAKNLPTWRPSKENIVVRLWKKFLSGRDVTGYHITMFLLVILIFHLPFVFGLTRSFFLEVKILSLLFLFFALWDFLWFVCNPHYPLRHFRKEHIDWHKKWFFGFPRDYWIAIFFSFAVLTPFQTLWYWWVMNLVLFALWTCGIIFFTLFVLHIDDWKKGC